MSILRVALVATATIIVITLIMQAWSLWVRRITWGSRWERAVTLSIALQGTCVLMLTPIGSNLVGGALHTITGLHHTQFLIGHACLILSAGAFVYSVLDRIYDDDDELRESFKQWVEQPVILIVVGIFVAFRLGDLGVAPTFHNQSTGVLDLYWTIFCGGLLYLLIYAGRALLVVRQDWRQRRIADLYLVVCMSAGIACVTRLTTSLLPSVPDGHALANLSVVLLGGISLVSFALASAYSWRQKAERFSALSNALAD